MIVLTHVEKVVGGNTHISIDALTVAAGEITAVTNLTPPHDNTLLLLLTGQTTPTAGTVRLAGHDPALEPAAFAQKVGLLPAKNGLYPRLTNRQNLAFFANLYGLPPSRVDDVLAQVGLQDRDGERAQELTSGLARRLAFGRALLHQPPILLLVQPFADCDDVSVKLLQRAIRDAAAADTAVLILTNDTNRANQLCDTIHTFENGRLSHSYKPGETSSETNLPFKIPARLEGKVALINPADILFATTSDGQTELVLANGRIPTHLTLTEVEERLSKRGFFRAHRSYLVNLQHVRELISYTRDSYTLILDTTNGAADQTNRLEIPLSKGAARDLRDLLDF